MTVFTQILTFVIGIAFMFFAFFATGIRGAFSRGPSHPISTTGRIIIFLAGAAVFVDGFNRIFSGSSASHVWWFRGLPFVVVAMMTVVLNAKRVRAYVARRVTSKPDIAVRFSGGFPSALVALRVAFFVVVSAMVVLAFAPLAFSTAKLGIIACVLALFALGLFYEVLEGHYINTGRASVIKLTDDDAKE
jgi:hypothetical protein